MLRPGSIWGDTMAELEKSAAPLAPSGPVAAERARALVQRLRREQNLVGGFLAGLAASAVGAAIWAVVPDVANFQIGFMASESASSSASQFEPSARDWTRSTAFSAPAWRCSAASPAICSPS